MTAPPRGSGAEVDSQVPAGKGLRADFGGAIEPRPLVRAPGPRSQQRSIGGEAGMISGVADFGEFGVDGAQAGVGELVLDVPSEALAVGLGFLEGLFGAGDFGFGV